MSNPSYNSSKVQHFLNAMKRYQTDKSIYMNSLNTFNEQINTITDSHKKAKNSTDPDFEPQYKDNMTYNSFITSEGVVVYKNGSTASADGFQENALNSSKQYISDLHINANNYSGKVSNAVVQMGLNDLTFNNDNAVNEVYKIPTTSVPVIDNSTVGATTMAPQTCDINFLYACDSNAKQNDMPYYGIADKSGDSCQCYTFTDTNKPTTIIQPTIRKGIVTLIETSNVSNISYLGTLFDGALYALKEDVYRDNFTDLYDASNSNIIEINSANRDNTQCNPFTGYGVNKITFNSLGETICQET